MNESEGQDELIIDDRPIPADVAGRMRTLERPPSPMVSAASDPEEFNARAFEVLEEIEDGLFDDLGLSSDLTGLGVSQERNRITGARGLILRRLMRRGRYSAPLAEIFSDAGRLDLRGKQSFYAFRTNAYHRGLDYWIHEVKSEAGFFYIAFAIARVSEDKEWPIYLARLLVTPFEIGQWRNEFLEVGCARPS
jgi:hypothetical protein